MLQQAYTNAWQRLGVCVAMPRKGIALRCIKNPAQWRGLWSLNVWRWLAIRIATFYNDFYMKPSIDRHYHV